MVRKQLANKAENEHAGTNFAGKKELHAKLVLQAAHECRDPAEVVTEDWCVVHGRAKQEGTRNDLEHIVGN